MTQREPDNQMPTERREESLEPSRDVEARRSPEADPVAALLAHSLDVPVLAEAVARQEAPDAADTLEHLEEEEAADVLVAMDEQFAADALAEMEIPLAASVLDDLIDEGHTEYAGRMLHLMAPDDAADLLQALDLPRRSQLFRAMPASDVVRLRRLVGYDEDTAGGLMTPDYYALFEDLTVAEATGVIRDSQIPEDLHDMPVINRNMRLVGIVGLRTLLLNKADRRLGDLIEQPVRSIGVNTDQEEVAREFERYDLFMLPVVDDDERLLGIITVDDVIDIIREEQTEDVQKTVGAGPEEAVYSRLSEKFRGRFPWLVTSLVMTCVAALVVLFFEELIRERPVLAFLMPVIAALVGNAGHQALAVTLRGIVLNEVRPERVGPLIWREAALGLLNGIVLGALMILVVTLLGQISESATWQVGVVAGVALAVSMCAGTLAGAGIPLMMRRLGADPAQSSAIFLIMITDAVAFATFLGLIHLSHRWLAGATA